MGWDKQVYQTEFGALMATPAVLFEPIATRLSLDVAACWVPEAKSAVFMYIYAAKSTEKAREREIVEELYGRA